jgi:ferritin
VEEQVEEEKTFGDLIEMLERVGDSGSALLVVDARLGERAG